MADERSDREAAEERFGNKLPQQVRDQLAQIEQFHQPPRDPEDEPPPIDEPPGDEDDGDEGDEESWEQRARSTMGRLEQAMNANAQLAKRISDLERENTMSRVRNGTAGVAEQPGATPPVRTRLIKDEEVQDYGDEFMDVVGRRAQEAVAEQLHQYEKRINQLENRTTAVGQVIDQTQKRSVYDTLYDEVPNWKSINHHPAFQSWLQTPDIYSGRPRQEMLTEAFSRHDAPRVVAFFKGFLTEATGTPSNSPGNGNSAPPLAQNGNGSGRPSLEDFAAPGRARSAPQELPPDKPLYSSAWIERFMADKLAGKFRGREAEVEATERDIYQAQHEGRIH